jgi:signal transduction histidine kinase
VVQVKDTGCGIPEDHLPHIFDPFFSTKEVGYGTGLGLSVAHGIIEQHNGTLSVESKVGEGSVFTIRLPLREENYLGD